jgi:hypothetical protein
MNTERVRLRATATAMLGFLVLLGQSSPTGSGPFQGRLDRLERPASILAGFQTSAPSWFEATFTDRMFDQLICTKVPNNCSVALRLPGEAVRDVSERLRPINLSQSSNSPTVHITVKHNGEEIAPPADVIFSIRAHSVRLPVTKGIFEVPSEIAEAPIGEKIGFQTEVDGDRILTKVGPQHFGDGENWTLILEDTDFGPRFSRLVSKDTPALSGCAIVFAPRIGDGVEMFDAHCRTRIKK